MQYNYNNNSSYTPVTLRIETLRLLSNLAARVFDLLLARHEQQHVASALELVYLHHTKEKQQSHIVLI